MEKDEVIKSSILNAMSSEHCSYGSSKKYLANLHTTGEHVIQGPGENAGIVDLGQGMAFALRMESHNHPSAEEPFQGAATGVGGILRDIFTMGAKPIALLDNLRFGTNQISDHRQKEVVRGISYYGRTVGVPTVGGEIYLDKTYNENPLVNVCAMGLVERKNIIYGHALTPGNELIYVGRRTGMDGVGGAEFASMPYVPGAAENVKAIQNSDPFLEKLLLDACVELAPTGWVEGMQDMGAAGLLCSTTEIAYRGQKRTGLQIGTRVDLDRIPLSVESMSPEDILRSESQERMLIVARKGHTDKILETFRRWDLEAVVIGEVTNDGNYTMEYTQNGQKMRTVMTIEQICGDINFDQPRVPWKPQGGIYQKASKVVTERAWRQYDWRVGTRTIKGPNEPGHYAILDIEEIGKEVVVSWGSDEGRSDENPTMGIRHAFNRALDYQAQLGAEPLGLTNCLNFGHPQDSMEAFAQTTEELARICRETEIPVVSGNVSLYNQSNGVSIKPTPILVMAGIRDKR